MAIDTIILKDWRSQVDNLYLGFHPNGDSIKPVHIAGGVFRSIYGKIADTSRIKQVSYVSSKKGITPPNNTLEKVREYLESEDLIKPKLDELDSMRNVMQKLLDVDNGVFSGEKDGQVSYSAGSKYFITRKAQYEDAGEFIGELLKEYCPELVSEVKQILEDARDPISLLFSPIKNDDDFVEACTSSSYSEIQFPDKNNAIFKWFTEGLKESSKSLAISLNSHPNALTRLRLFVIFCNITLIRYMSLLEGFYVEHGTKRPIILDFSNTYGSNVATMSELSFTQMHRSISRFYSWAFANQMKDISIEELISIGCPKYDSNSKKERNDGSNKIWECAIEEARMTSGSEAKKLLLGEAMYNMLALESNSFPVKYVKAIGSKSGILYGKSSKRFVLTQDVIEMIIRCSVGKDEIIDGNELRHRLWDRFGIIVGGGTFEFEQLSNNGMITQIDSASLEDNYQKFASVLESMDFAEMLADGILQIRIGA